MTSKRKRAKLRARNTRVREAVAMFDNMPGLDTLPADVQATLGPALADARAKMAELAAIIDESDAELNAEEQ